MGQKSFYLFFLFLLCFSSTAHAKFPIHLGGFVLGDNIKNYNHKIHTGGCQSVVLNKYLGEEQVIPPQGFKSGRITYGLCDRPDKILRIKLKFADSSKDFFNILLGKYKEKLGEPDEYKGDPFQTIIAWKWSFTNEQNEKISLILQHNMMVKDEKMGNSVKLTLISQFEKEEKCCLAKIVKKKPSVQPKLNKKAMWKLFVPF